MESITINKNEHCNLFPLQGADCEYYCPLDVSHSIYSIRDTCFASLLVRIKSSPTINNLVHIIQYIAFPNRHYVIPVQYYNSIITLDSNMEVVVSMTIPFSFINCSTTGVNFICGLIVKDDSYIISYGIDDISAYIATVPKHILPVCEKFNLTDIIFIDNHNEIYNLEKFMIKYIDNVNYIEVFKYLLDKISKNKILEMNVYIDTLTHHIL